MHIELPPEPSSLSRVREFVASTLEDHGIESWEVVLVASELASNVVRHARTPYTVVVRVLPDAIRLEVMDGAAALRVGRKLSDREGGYGLRMVETLAEDWGVEQRAPDSKVVWVRLSRPG